MPEPITISNRALVNWMERTGLVDLDPVREALAESVSASIAAAGVLGVSNFLILADGLVYQVRDGVLCGVMPEDGRHRHVHLLARRAEEDDRG